MAGGNDGSSDSTVSTVLSEWLIVVLIVFSTVFEFLLHRVEHWIFHKHHHLQAVVRTLYRELMVLGIVSFLFILYELIIHPSSKVILSFEFAHLFIFLFAVFYTIVVMSTMFTSLRLSSRWKHMEQIELVKYLHFKDQYARMRIRLHKHNHASWRLIRWWFPNLMLPWRYWQLHEIMAFHDIRFQFIFYRNLPDHFRFSSFLRKIKSATFIELVESHWSLYTIFLAIVLADIIRREITDPGDDLVFETSFHIAAAITIAVFVQILDVKIRRVYWELTKHPRIYYEGLQPDHVAEELAAAGDRLAAERARRRSRSSDLPPEDTENLADDEATDINAIAASPESEMLGPMHGPNLSSEYLRHSADDSLASRLPYKPRASVNGFMSKVSSQKAPDIASSHHHSLDLSRPRLPIPSNPSDTVLTDLGEALAHPSQTNEESGGVANGITQRHSLEIARQPEIVARPAPSRNAELAKAAVQAAHRRSLDKPTTSPRGRSLEYVDEREFMSDKSGLRFFKKGWTSRGASTDEDGTRGSRDVTRKSRDYGSRLSDAQARRNERVSIDLVAAMPREELAKRNVVHQQEHFAETRLDMNSDLDEDAGTTTERDTSVETGTKSSLERRVPRIRFSVGNDEMHEDKIEMNGGRDKVDESESEQTAPNFIQRHKSLAFLNASILKNLEHQENAKNMTPTNYPWWVTKVIPRLGRVASPVEKLFWFGSHKFFLWCVEFTLFFSTVLQAAVSATLSLELIENEEVAGLVIASFVLAVFSLLFVLFRIAGVIKKYIFILHNASLVPEDVALEAIDIVSQKRAGRASADLSDISGSEAEKEEAEVAKEKRRKLGRFFQSEAESGNIPGIVVANGESSGRESSERPARRMRMRKVALRRRRARVNSSSGIPAVPVVSQVDESDS